MRRARVTICFLIFILVSMITSHAQGGQLRKIVYFDEYLYLQRIDPSLFDTTYWKLLDSAGITDIVGVADSIYP